MDNHGGTANGGQELSLPQSFMVNVGQVNQAPTLDPITNPNDQSNNFTLNEERTHADDQPHGDQRWQQWDGGHHLSHRHQQQPGPDQ